MTCPDCGSPMQPRCERTAGRGGTDPANEYAYYATCTNEDCAYSEDITEDEYEQLGGK